jgi:C1A family cysteine protease
MSKEKLIWFIIFIFIFLIIYYNISTENYEFYTLKRKEEDPNITGQKKEIRYSQLVHVGANIIPFRKQVHTYVVNVPLTPFKSPLIILSQTPEKDLFPYLQYKTEYLSPINNQGDCGACYAFAGLAMLADRLVIETGGMFDQSLSVQQVLSCFAPDSCSDGGSPEELCINLAKTQFGINMEKYMPYKQQSGGYVTSKCPSDLQGPEVYVIKDSVRSIVEFIPEENYDKVILNKNILNMKRTLTDFGPFFAAMTVYDDLFSFDGTTVYKKHKKAEEIGGHAIEIIGYCDTGIDSRKGFESAYWICRNSWSTNWPTKTKDGYFCIEMGTNMCGIESRCAIASPKIIGTYAKNKKPLSLKELRYENYS